MLNILYISFNITYVGIHYFVYKQGSYFCKWNKIPNTYKNSLYQILYLSHLLQMKLFLFNIIADMLFKMLLYKIRNDSFPSLVIDTNNGYLWQKFTTFKKLWKRRAFSILSFFAKQWKGHPYGLKNSIDEITT